MRQHHVWMLVEQANAGFEIGLPVKVVMRGPFEQRRLRQLKDPVEIGHCPEIVLMAHIAYARIAPHIIVANLLRAVGGGVVADDDLEVAEALRQEALHSLREKHLAVVDGQANRKPGRGASEVDHL